MKTVALVGLATATRNEVNQSKANEIWTLNWAYKYDFIPRIDRLFEMHPIWLYGKTKLADWQNPRQHWRWLHEERTYPVYMLTSFSSIPNCIRYPIEDITDYIFGNKLNKGTGIIDFYSSSFDYMMAMAIYEKFDVIELYGFEMGSDTEYRYQREGAAFFIGQAIARGITVKMPSNTVLLRNKKYGYEGGQMIYRQDIERLKDNFTKQRIDAVSTLQFMEGKFNTLLKNKVPDDELKKASDELQEARDTAHVASGAEQAMLYVLQYIDLEEPEAKLTNPLKFLSFDDEDLEPEDDWLI